MLARVRRLRGSAGSQTPQSPRPSAPPIIGTPADPPVPVPTPVEPPPAGESEADPTPGRPVSVIWWLALAVWVAAFLVLWGAELFGLIYRVLMGS